jgi:hypothetical protein
MIWMKSLFHQGNQSVKHHINEKDDMCQGQLHVLHAILLQPLELLQGSKTIIES